MIININRQMFQALNANESHSDRRWKMMFPDEDDEEEEERRRGG